MADGGVVVTKLGNAGGAKAPCSGANVQSRKSPGIGVRLSTPLESVRTLQSALQTKAKSEAAYRFYSLWDKVCRDDVLYEAYRRCRANRGAAGVDGETFADIENYGLASWLQRLKQELRTKSYRCLPLLRVWIPKANGGQRPLGIPTVRDRVAQMAVLLVIGPIFDVDLFPWQYGFARARTPRWHCGAFISESPIGERAKWWMPTLLIISIRYLMGVCCAALRGGLPMGPYWRSYASGLTPPLSNGTTPAGKLARRWQGTPTAVHRKEALSPRCWRTCTSVVSCWRGTTVDMRGGYKLK